MTEEMMSQDLVVVYDPHTVEALGLDHNRSGSGTIDPAASCAKFDELWRARIRVLYPDVEFREGQRGLRIVARDDDYPQDNDRANELFQACQREAELLRQEPGLWTVYKA